MSDQNILIVVIVALVLALMGFSTLRKRRRRGLVKQKIVGGATILDVRSKAEFSGRHYDGAVNIPVENLSSRLKQLGPKDKAIVVYCASGARSARAHAILRAEGYTDVLNAGSLGNMP